MLKAKPTYASRDKIMGRVATALAHAEPEKARAILHEVIGVMVENEAWNAAAKLMIDQLGPNDALFSAERPLKR